MLSAWIGSLAFLCVAILYVFLALGFPLGEFAMGGKHKIMPRPMRAACAVSVLIQLLAIFFILQAGHVINVGFLNQAAKWVCYFFAVYLILNTVMNGMSPSRKEKMLMTPLSFIAAICFLITAWNG
ncbi:hypothetical protein MJA45_14150 [Paenibacillus aurantius]|uniref:Uncharacterized protein n=1 Tax=Paenibacillus aurantius TaxID=2918900 RepID=A0AA96RG49_9BACL|nr:hypothetical protein [Paenibacillus aurantius]WNQ14110.1 hypothetical protein MJA45_14150 [Paenibacillus aurantius]